MPESKSNQENTKNDQTKIQSIPCPQCQGKSFYCAIEWTSCPAHCIPPLLNPQNIQPISYQCYRCMGTGRIAIPVRKPCLNCNGTGIVSC